MVISIIYLYVRLRVFKLLVQTGLIRQITKKIITFETRVHTGSNPKENNIVFFFQDFDIIITRKIGAILFLKKRPKTGHRVQISLL